MRVKAYYSANEIISNLYTSGLEYMTSDNIEYIGLYHKYTTGEVYSESTWNEQKSIKLITYKNQHPNVIAYNNISNINLDYNPFKTYNVVITKQDIVNGFINRYILKKINEFKFYEVNKKTYNEYQNARIDPSLYLAAEIIWEITGPLNTIQDDSVIINSVRSKNISAIARAEKKLPNLSTYLTDPLQYYSDNDNVTPVDINGLD